MGAQFSVFRAYLKILTDNQFPKEDQVINLTLITVINNMHLKTLVKLFKPTRGFKLLSINNCAISILLYCFLCSLSKLGLGVQLSRVKAPSFYFDSLQLKKGEHILLCLALLAYSGECFISLHFSWEKSHMLEYKDKFSPDQSKSPFFAYINMYQRSWIPRG